MLLYITISRRDNLRIKKATHMLSGFLNSSLVKEDYLFTSVFSVILGKGLGMFAGLAFISS